MPQLLMAVGISLILYGLGHRATVQTQGWLLPGPAESWTLTGAGGLVLILYSTLSKPPECPICAPPALTARIAGNPLPEKIQMIEVMATDSARLYGYYRRVLNDFYLRIEANQLDDGCLTFLFVMEPEISVLHVHTDNFKKVGRQINSSQETIQLLYTTNNKNEPELHHVHNQGMDSLSSHSSLCKIWPGQNQLDSQSNTSFVRSAYAQDDTESLQDRLVMVLGSSSSLSRIIASRILPYQDPMVVSKILARFDEFDIDSPEWNRLAEDSARILDRMLARGIAPERVREQIPTPEHLLPFVSVLDHADKSLRNLAMTGLLRLHDPRVSPFLLEVLENSVSTPETKFYAVLGLASIFSELSEPQKNAIYEQSFAANDKVQAVLEWMRGSQVDSRNNVFLPYVAPLGWTYVGKYDDGTWSDKNFDFDGDQELPNVGDVLVAKRSKGVRDRKIEYDDGNQRWVESGIAGLIEKSGRVRVKTIETVRESFVWAEVEPAE